MAGAIDDEQLDVALPPLRRLLAAFPSNCSFADGSLHNRFADLVRYWD